MRIDRFDGNSALGAWMWFPRNIPMTSSLPVSGLDSEE
jgi:hypothetical protein